MVIARCIKTDTKLYQRLNGFFCSLDWIFEVRPVLLLSIWTMMTAGISAYKGTTINEFYWATTFNWSLFFAFLGMTLIACSSALKGNDSETEKFTLILFISGIIVVLSSVAMEAEAEGRISLLFAVGAWTSVFYVSWRAYLKYREKLVDKKLLMNIPFSGVPALSLFMIGWHLADGRLMSGLFASVPYSCGFIAVALLWDLSVKAEELYHRDFMDGVVRPVGIGSVLLVLSTILGYRMGDPVVSTAAIIAVPFFVVALVFPRSEHIIRAFRYPLMILAFFVGIRYPWLLFAMFLNYNVVRWYNYFRHGIIRPTLKVIYD